MPYEIVEAPDAVRIYGACFVDGLRVEKPLEVDGDLIVNGLVIAPDITVRNGSFIAREWRAAGVNAMIYGTFAPFDVPSTVRYTWLRPVFEMPTATCWQTEDVIASVVTLFTRPELVTDMTVAAPWLAKALARPNCGRARVLLQAALEELRTAQALTPLGRAVVDPLLAHNDLPKHWRW